MKRIGTLIILCIIAFFSNAQPAMKVNSIEFKASYYKYKGILIDVRTPQEFAEGHIENAKNIDITNNNFDPEIDKIDKSQVIFLYCAIGVRSGRAAAALRKKGFKNVFDLDGGYSDLLKVGMKNSK